MTIRRRDASVDDQRGAATGYESLDLRRGSGSVLGQRDCPEKAATRGEGTEMSAEITIYNPDELGPPMGQYTHVTRVKANEFLFIAGMLSGDRDGNVIGEGDFEV